jgi:hypothetical protein
MGSGSIGEVARLGTKLGQQSVFPQTWRISRRKGKPLTTTLIHRDTRERERGCRFFSLLLRFLLLLPSAGCVSNRSQMRLTQRYSEPGALARPAGVITFWANHRYRSFHGRQRHNNRRSVLRLKVPHKHRQCCCRTSVWAANPLCPARRASLPLKHSIVRCPWGGGSSVL